MGVSGRRVRFAPMKRDYKTLVLITLAGLLVVLAAVWFLASGPQSFSTEDDLAPPKQPAGKSAPSTSGKSG